MRFETSEKNWLQDLMIHYERMKHCYPFEKWVILFNADTLVLDIRHVIHFLLRSFDPKTRGTFLSFLKAPNYGYVNESSEIIRDLPTSFDNKEETLIWYLNNQKRAEAVINSTKYYSRLMELIRSFESRPDTYIGFISQKAPAVRHKAWHVIKDVCGEYGITLKECHLAMVASYPVPGQRTDSFWKRHFGDKGYRIIAALDINFKVYRDIKLELDTPVFSMSKERIFNAYAEVDADSGAPERRMKVIA